MRQLQQAYDLRVRWRGFVLHPEIPVGGIHPDRLFPRHIREMFYTRIKHAAQEFGLPLHEAHDHIPNTHAALAVSEWARAQSEEALEAFRDATMDAWWARGEDIEDEAVLARLAVQAGLDPTEAIAASRDPLWHQRIDEIRQEAHARRVSGIPTFFFGDLKVVGCQPYQTLEATAKMLSIPPLKRSGNAASSSLSGAHCQPDGACDD